MSEVVVWTKRKKKDRNFALIVVVWLFRCSTRILLNIVRDTSSFPKKARTRIETEAGRKRLRLPRLTLHRVPKERRERDEQFAYAHTCPARNDPRLLLFMLKLKLSLFVDYLFFEGIGLFVQQLRLVPGPGLLIVVERRRAEARGERGEGGGVSASLHSARRLPAHSLPRLPFPPPLPGLPPPQPPPQTRVHPPASRLNMGTFLLITSSR